MKELYLEYLSLEFSEFKMPNHFDSNIVSDINNSQKRLKEIYEPIKAAVLTSTIVSLPNTISKNLDGLVSTFLDHFRNLNSSAESGNRDGTSRAIERIAGYYLNFFEFSSNNRDQNLLNVIRNFKNDVSEDVIRNLAASNIEFNDLSIRTNRILEKLENPSSEKVLATYSNVFQAEETKSNRAASIWIFLGLISLVTFIMIIKVSIKENWFPSTLQLNTIESGRTKTIDIINIPLIVTKVMVFSLIIYLIIFCFKQYSIYKNIAQLNQQRKNAFNSLDLFIAALGDTDKEAKKILLTSLAKTLHENVSTGFLALPKNEPAGISNTLDFSKLSTPG